MSSSSRDVQVRVNFVGSIAQLEQEMTRLKDKAEVTSSEIGDKFEKGSQRAGGALSKLGGALGNFGLPFGNQISLIGDKFGAVEAKGKNFQSSMAEVGKGLALGGLGAFAGLAYEGVKSAISFQEGLTSLATGAGESEKNLKKVGDGILSISGQTATSSTDLTNGMYMIESAGYHGAAGLSVLKAAAEGAKVGNADLQTVADALTSTLNAYGMKASNATAVTNEMVATVAAGKMHMNDLAQSLSAVLPTAAAAGISYAQVGGAIATMTSQGMSAQQATQDLANTIRSLQNPNQTAISEMQQLGLNSQDVAKNIGKNGLTGTLSTLVNAITTHMGPAGLVIQSAFKNSTVAAQDAQTMLNQLPPSLQNVAKEFMNGQITSKAWRKEIQAMPADQKGLATQFASTVTKAHSFNSMLKTGSPAAQTFNAALSSLTGGSTGLNTTLLLTGSHMATFEGNVKSIAKAARHTKGDVHGWNQVQKDLGFQLTQAQDAAQGLVTKLGMALIPEISSAIKGISSLVTWFEHHKAAAIALGVVIGGFAATALTIWIAGMVKAGIESAKNFGKMTSDAATWASKRVTASGRAQLAAEKAAQAEAKAAEQTEATQKQSAATAEETAAQKELAAEETGTAVQASATEQQAALEGVQVTEEAASATSEATGLAIDGALGPIGLAIGVITAAIGFLGPHWKAIWHDIKHVIDVAWTWITNHLGWIEVALGPLGIAIAVLHDNWKSIWHGIKTAVHDAWKFVKPIFDSIGGALGTIGKAASAVGGFFSSIFGGGGGHSSKPKGLGPRGVPKMAAGGIVSEPTLAILGEAGPEMVIPVGLSGVGLNQPAPLPSGRGGMGGVSTQTTNNIVMQGTSEQLTRQMQSLIEQQNEHLLQQIGAA